MNELHNAQKTGSKLASSALKSFQDLLAIRKLAGRCTELIRSCEAGEKSESSSIELLKSDLQKSGIIFISNWHTDLTLLEDLIFEKLAEAEANLVARSPSSASDALAMMEFALLRLKDGELDQGTITMMERSLQVLKEQEALG